MTCSSSGSATGGGERNSGPGMPRPRAPGCTLHLLDYLQLEDLLGVCQAAGRWSFPCVIAPLRLSGRTGSPVNPIAIL